MPRDKKKTAMIVGAGAGLAVLAYAFEGLEPGSYTVRFEKEGFETIVK